MTDETSDPGVEPGAAMDAQPVPEAASDNPRAGAETPADQRVDLGAELGAELGGELDAELDLMSAPDLDDDELGAVLEALLLVVDTPVTIDALASATEQPGYRIAAKLAAMAQDLAERDSGIDLREAGGGWRMYTRAKYAPYVERLLLDGARTKLTRAALETLAVVAYRQPVTRARVSAVRGVNVDAVMRTLLARGLITEAGTDPDTGATTFATTDLFLERLGLTSLEDLPDIAPLLPDVDVIDDLSENLGDEPRFAKLNGNSPNGDQPAAFDVDKD
ncbi:SMC-Scp complex subunit ScpB [Mycolicibacterium smegmatis]|uniref:SMC-Scp complex subunit ScpB n=1 Tax=Mycolicibacterium smegmatis TaxID=1772 RepID=UPI001E42CDFC|nr:SMC-Scp complex subunit ScpB [Mycolicibacterium smegmatis]UGU32827.1 SMC-Scp complex subunit ScpB [Mycolicibacterium smegmatis]ULN67710.1 SMC-Scp complex subunit ScpB [Mycolicibacterium smegmatis]